MADPPDCENGELQPEPGRTAEERENGRRIETHNRPVTAPIEDESTRLAPDASTSQPS